MVIPQSKKKFKVVTLGCRTNQYESQAYTDQLIQLGYRPAAENESADVCIINTCTVTASADNQSRHEIRQLAAKNPGAKLVVTGCAVEQHPDQIRRIEGVTAVISNKDKESLIEVLFPDLEVPEFAIKHFESHTRAFVKVQDGCNSFCTYCVIPYVRGRSRSRPIPDIITEVESLIANGYKEIVITGINVGDYDGGKSVIGQSSLPILADQEVFDAMASSEGLAARLLPSRRTLQGEPRSLPKSGGGADKLRKSSDAKPGTLADLLRKVDEIPGLKRLRLSSIDPDEVTDDLMDIIINGKTTCHSMHIVLQSGSNVILKRMNRKYTRQIFMESIDRMRSASPSFTFTTDVIVGFPGETEIDFQETLAVINEVQFAKVHMFPFSERERTRAALMPNKVDPQIIKQRKQQVLRTSELAAFNLQARFLGQRMRVLTEGVEDDAGEFIDGHTDNFLKVYFPRDQWCPNQLLEVELVENSPKGLRGKVVKEF